MRRSPLAVGTGGLCQLVGGRVLAGCWDDVSAVADLGINYVKWEP